MSQMLISFTHRNYVNMTTKEKTDAILQRSSNREEFFSLAVKMHSICYQRGLRLIMENPWSEQTFLKTNFITNPTFVDKNRALRGDAFAKPTAYWFVNCTPTHGRSYTKVERGKNICQLPPSKQAGICGEERSMISKEYARNFICDFVIGKQQNNTLPDLFG